MEKIYHSLTELIGRTPLLEISHIEKKEQLKARVLVKLESFNPGGSVKDRAAFYMIEAAEKEGLLHPGSLIIEPTSGNTGIGLAWIASVKGYRLTLTMPETMSLERRNLLKALGATLVLTPGSEGMKGAIRSSSRSLHSGTIRQPGQSGSTRTNHSRRNMERHRRKSGLLRSRRRYGRYHQRNG
jgi:cysteine synthase A